MMMNGLCLITVIDKHDQSGCGSRVSKTATLFCMVSPMRIIHSLSIRVRGTNHEVFRNSSSKLQVVERFTFLDTVKTGSGR